MSQDFAEEATSNASTAQNSNIQDAGKGTEENKEDTITAQPDTQFDALDNAMEAEEDENAAAGVVLELETAQKEIAELKDTLLRTVAEQENFKKRMERERLARIKYEGERIFKEFLPVVDNLERAVEQGAGQGSAEGASAEKNLDALLEGVQMTLKILLANLAKFEVKPIESVNAPFDPQHQEALTMDTSDTIPENHVIAEFEKGYYFKDRLLRPAKVIVSSGVAEK